MALLCGRRRSSQGGRPPCCPGCLLLEPERTHRMDPHDDQRMLEAILCTLVAQAGGTVTLRVPVIAACGCNYRLAPQTDWQGQTVTLTLETVPAPEPCQQPEPKRIGSPQRLRTRRH